MSGWQIPPPKKPTKSKAERIKQALLKVPREDFIPGLYQDYAYLEVRCRG